MPCNYFIQVKHSVSAVSASVVPLQDKKRLVVLPPHNINNIIIAISSAFRMVLVVSKKLSFEPVPFSVKSFLLLLMKAAYTLTDVLPIALEEFLIFELYKLSSAVLDLIILV